MSTASHDAHAEVQEIALDEREINTPRPDSNSPSRNKQAVKRIFQVNVPTAWTSISHARLPSLAKHRQHA